MNWDLRNSEPLEPKEQLIYDDLMADMRPLSSPFTAIRFLEHYEPEYKIGSSFTTKSFWSTTVDFNFKAGREFDITTVIILMIPRGADAIMIQSGLEESEIILPPGTKMKVKHKAIDDIRIYGEGNENNKISPVFGYALPYVKEIYVIYVKN